jgi:hypothetical protein
VSRIDDINGDQSAAVPAEVTQPREPGTHNDGIIDPAPLTNVTAAIVLTISIRHFRAKYWNSSSTQQFSPLSFNNIQTLTSEKL